MRLSRRRPLRNVPVIGIGLLIAASGCATYIPAPVDTATQVRAFATTDLGLAADSVLSETEALALALERSPQVRQAAAAYASAAAAARTARVRPSLTLNLTSEYSSQADPQHPWLFGGAIDVPVDAGERRSARLSTADLQILQARYAYADALWRVRDRLHRAVLERDLASREQHIAQQQVAVQSEHVSVVERRIAAGEDDRSLALQAEAARIVSTRRLAAARAAVASADVAVAAALSVPVERMNGLVIQPLAPEASMSNAQRLSGLREAAATARSDVLSLVAAYDIAEDSVRAAVAAQYPAVVLAPGYTWERGITKLPFGLSLQLPPADLNRSAIDEAEARRSEAGRALEAAQATVFAEVDTAAAGLSSAVLELERLSREEAVVAERTLRNVERSRQLGAADRSDLLLAQATTLDVALDMIDVERRRNQFAADLDLALRHSDDAGVMSAIALAMSHLEPGR